jgi:riboflavin biosynthesis pyrimidine reductase
MQQVFPDERLVDDPLALLAADHRPTPAGRPWVMANMVASVDGAWAVDGRSGGLSGPADRAVFHSLRALADVVLVAAGTARAERYRRPWPVPEAQELRAGRDQAPAARLALVSRSLHVPADQPFLAGDGPVPLVFHPATVDPSDLAGLPHGVEPRVSGESSVDLTDVLEQLARDEGSRLVLCEGGPRLLGQLHAADLLDEMFVTISPSLVGGAQVGMLGGVAPVVHRLELHRVLVEDGSLLCTYRRRRD